MNNISDFMICSKDGTLFLLLPDVERTIKIRI